MSEKIEDTELVPFGSPELSDGQHWAAMDKASILQSVEEWLKYAEDGDECSIRVKAMTKSEIEALPDL